MKAEERAKGRARAADDGRVKWQEVFGDLREELRNGVYPQGVPLPSERALCRKYGISRITSVRVMDELRKYGDIADRPFDDYRKYQQCENMPAPAFRDELIAELSDSASSLKALSDEYAEPVASTRDALERLDPLKSVVKRMIGRR